MRVEMGDSIEGGMTLEFKAYQDEDMERDLPPLQVRCTQDNNDESLSNPLHDTEEKLEPGPNVEDESDDYEVVHIEHVRPEGKYQENIEGKYNDQGMVCEFCNRLFGTFYYIKYHWCFSCPELGLRDRNKFISRFKMTRKCGTQPSLGHQTAKGRGGRKAEEVTITSEKLVDRNTTILNELEVLKKALMEKTMNKEKTNLLAKWILDEKTKQIKDETTDKDYEPVDEVQIDMGNNGSSLNGQYILWRCY